MAKGTITIRTDPEVEERLGCLVEATRRSRQWLVEEALREYLATHAWQIEGMQRTQRSPSECKMFSIEAVLADLQAKIDRRRRARKRR